MKMQIAYFDPYNGVSHACILYLALSYLSYSYFKGINGHIAMQGKMIQVVINFQKS